MRKFVENYLGVILFYSVLAVGALLISTRVEKITEKENNSNTVYSERVIANK